MRAGTLRHQLTLQAKSVTKDSYGAEVVTWVTFATVPGDAQPISGREFSNLMLADADITTRFVIRYMDDVKPSMRVVWDGLAFNITHILNVGGRNRELELLGYADAA